ncbi:MAG: TolC family protein [Candidatus Omnitrophica bacterium]|nr:TolC family protein [Candidatus Omnitrophota bacterium]
MQRRCAVYALIFFLAVFNPAQNTANAEEPLSLNNVINEALISNPEILSAKRSYEAASARIWQAASLNDPMVELEYDKMTADRMLTGDPMKTYAISQDIPFPTKLYLRAKIASKIARMSYESYKTKEKEIIARTKSAYAELFYIYRAIDINKENKGILEQLSQSATARYSKGLGTQGDALKAQVELATVDTELIMLEQKRVTAQARLNILLNRDPGEELGVPAPEEAIKFESKLEECYSLAEQNNPELKAYRYGIERGKTAYDLSLNEFMPDFTLKYKQMVQGDKAVGDAWAGMLGVTVPLWFFQKQAFGVKEMKSELEMLKAEYAAKEKAVLFDVRDAYARVEANKKLVELYETAFLPQAEETLNASIKGYESDKTDFLTLLDSRRMLVDFKLKHYNAILDLRIAVADLERAIGASADSEKPKEVKNAKK